MFCEAQIEPGECETWKLVSTMLYPANGSLAIFLSHSDNTKSARLLRLNVGSRVDARSCSELREVLSYIYKVPVFTDIPPMTQKHLIALTDNRENADIKISKVLLIH